PPLHVSSSTGTVLKNTNGHDTKCCGTPGIHGPMTQTTSASCSPTGNDEPPATRAALQKSKQNAAAPKTAMIGTPFTGRSRAAGSPPVRSTRSPLRPTSTIRQLDTSDNRDDWLICPIESTQTSGQSEERPEHRRATVEVAPLDALLRGV